MRIFGIEIKRAEKALNAVPSRGGWRTIFEPFTGAWQRNIEESVSDVVCYPTLYACLARISQDIGKLPYTLKAKGADGVWREIENTAYSPVLRKPNPWQTAQQFRESWMLSKLMHGNTYALKMRDARGVVNALYILDPCRVLPLVADDGAVFYQVQTDNLRLIPEDGGQLTIPASEIIHDRCMTVHHPLVGVPPVCAANWPAVKNLRILRSSAEFFANSAMPGGILTAPAAISSEDAERIQKFWNESYSGKNAGKVAVIGGDMKFVALASAKAADSQLVEQMRYSDEQICQPFGIPPFVVGIGTIPAGLKADDMSGVYYRFALQTHIEAMENLLDEGLSIQRPMGVELDTEPLLRMDTEKRATVWGAMSKSGIATPNEARAQFDLPPLEGGSTVYKQMQDLPLEQAQHNRPATAEPAPQEPDEVKQLRADLWQAKALQSTREAIHA